MPAKKVPTRDTTSSSVAGASGSSSPGMLETIKNRILSVALFSPGPFYFFPPKAVLNAVYGSDFETSYYHFRQNHRNAVNVSLHVVCFFVQIVGNFALLHELDKHSEKIPGVRLLSLVSAAMWSLVQLASPAPKLASGLATACIWGAYNLAPFVTPRIMDHGSFGGFLLTLVLSNIATGIVSTKDMAKAFAILTPIFAGSQYLEENTDYFMSKSSQSTQIMQAVIGYLAALPLLLRNPLKPLVVTSVFVCRLAYILTGEKILFYLGYVFLASLFQGVTHSVSKEEATLVALERKGDSAKISFEYGHVTYFPTLAVNSVIDSVRGIKPPSKPAHLKE